MDRHQQTDLSRSGFLKAATTTVAAGSLLGVPAILRSGRAEAAVSRGPVRGGTLTASVSEAIKILDAHISDLNTWRTIRENVWDTLIWEDLEVSPAALRPRLATSWRFSSPTTFDLTLRAGVKFHDGSTFTAEDAKFSLDRVLDPKVGSFLGPSLGPVQEVTVLGPLQLRIKMKQPFAGLPTGLTAVAIYPKTATQAIFTQHPIGTGPFTFKEFTPNVSTTLERFPDYWDQGFPYVDRVVLPVISQDAGRVAALLSGQTDMMLDVSRSALASLSKDSSVQIFRNVVRDRGECIYVNSHRAPFDRLPARQALQHAFDRQTFFKVLLAGYGVPNNSPWIPQNWAYNPAEGSPSRFPFDLKLAAGLLAKAGYPGGKGFSVKFTVVAGYPDFLAGAQMLQAAVALLGGTMDVATQEAPVWVNGLLNRDFDLSFDTVDRAALDPAATLATHVFYPPNSVVSKYTSPVVDNLLAQGAAKLTVAERRPYYWEYQRLWNQNVWGLVLGNIDIATAATKRVQGYTENSDSFRNFRHAYLSG